MITVRSWPARVGWFALLWAGGVLAVGAVALVFRVLMHMAGLSVG